MWSINDGKRYNQKKCAIYYIVSTARILHCNNHNLKRIAREEKYASIIRNSTAYILKRHRASFENLPPKPLDFIQTFSKYKLRNYNGTSHWRICVSVQSWLSRLSKFEIIDMGNRYEEKFIHILKIENIAPKKRKISSIRWKA